MNIKSAVFTLGSVLLLSSVSAQAEITGNIALATDYNFRGISQNDEAGVIQGGFDYSHENGFYAGLWGSNVDDNFYAGSSIELDTYLGWSGDAGPVSLDVGYLRYNYLDNDPSDPLIGYETDTDEFHIGVSKDFSTVNAGFTYYYSPDYYDAGATSYFDFSVGIPVNQFSIAAHYGVTSIDEKSAGTDLDYADFSIGISTEYEGLGFDLSYADTDDDGQCTGSKLCEGRVIFTMSKSM
jgi:uncharacterized protein (TIGR02001 family)